MLYIGINTGDETGFVVWNSGKRKIETVNTLNFWQCISNLERYKALNFDFTVIMEDPAAKKVLLKNDNTNNLQVYLRSVKKYAAAKRDADLITEYCVQNSICFRFERPCSINWSPAYFKQLTGIPIKGNKLILEAVKLVWGK